MFSLFIHIFIIIKQEGNILTHTPIIVKTLYIVMTPTYFLLLSGFFKQQKSATYKFFEILQIYLTSDKEPYVLIYIYYALKYPYFYFVCLNKQTVAQQQKMGDRRNWSHFESFFTSLMQRNNLFIIGCQVPTQRK